MDWPYLTMIVVYHGIPERHAMILGYRLSLAIKKRAQLEMIGEWIRDLKTECEFKETKLVFNSIHNTHVILMVFGALPTEIMSINYLCADWQKHVFE